MENKNHEVEKMEKISKRHVKNKKENRALYMKSLFSISFASILKFGVAIALLILSSYVVMALTVNYNGDVGIGTTNPGAKLDIFDSTNAIARLTTSTRTWMIEGTGGKFGISDLTAGIDRFTITKIGNVGIGTTSPDGTLDIQQTISGGAGNFLYLSTPPHGSTNNDLSRIVWRDGTTQDGGRYNIATIAAQLIHGGFGVGGNLIFSTKESGGDQTGFPTERMRITNSGNVGIGTASPAAKLHIMDADTVGTYMNVLAMGSGGATYQWHIRHWGGSTEAADRLEFSTHAFTPILVLKGNGNVGIGTTAPETKLDVTGDIRASGIYRVGNNAGVTAVLNFALPPCNKIAVTQMTVTGGIITGYTETNGGPCGG